MQIVPTAQPSLLTVRPGSARARLTAAHLRALGGRMKTPFLITFAGNPNAIIGFGDYETGDILINDNIPAWVAEQKKRKWREWWAIWGPPNNLTNH